MATIMKSNDSAIRAMQELLMARCKEEPSFLLKLSDPNKPLDKAINYLCNVIQKMGVCMVDDNTVLGILSHLYDGDADEEDIKNVNCNIVVSKPELSDEDKAELREQAMAQYKEEQLRAIRRENQPKPQTKATSAPKAGQEINVEQGNLFGEDF